jgi:hypothetical protein
MVVFGTICAVNETTGLASVAKTLSNKLSTEFVDLLFRFSAVNKSA